MLRFAPSPTGDMHIGHLRIAILNYLVSQQKDEQFLVRIEDLESQKNIEGKDSDIMMILEKFALKHDSVFHQSEHLNLYQTLSLRLLKEEKAFVCKCIETSCLKDCENFSSEDYHSLKKSAEKFVIRVKGLTSFILVKADGTPSYDFACASDDMMSGISFIIREEKYLENTPKQIHIQNLLGYKSKNTYVHIPNLSNSNEIPSLQWLLEEGFIPDAILNYLLLLENPNAPKEIFTLPKAIEWFDLNNISRSAPTFELDKLGLINREHLKLMDDKKLSTLFGFADADIGKLAKVYLEEECSTIKELEAKIRPIFTAKDFSGKWGEKMQVISKIIFQAPAFETFDAFKEHISTQSDLKDDILLQVLRQLLTATGDGPELSAIYPCIKSYILEVAS